MKRVIFLSKVIETVKHKNDDDETTGNMQVVKKRMGMSMKLFEKLNKGMNCE